jgi:predicted lipase
VEVHNGFAHEQARYAALVAFTAFACQLTTTHVSTAPAILSAVQNTLSTQGLSDVTVVGHSLGGALALLDGVFLGLHLPQNVTMKVITYGMPRVGNQAFADFVDSQLSGRVTHVNNQEDPVPVVPGRFLGFHHPSGEIHILDSGAWNACPGAFSSSCRRLRYVRTF